MDGRTRVHALISPVCILISCSIGSLVGAEDREKPLPSDSPRYMSSALDREFLGAVSLSLRIERTAETPKRKGELALLFKNRSESPKFKSRILPISLEPVSPESGSHSEATASQVPINFLVSGLPAELLKPGETVRVKLNSEGDEEDSASLTLCSNDGKPCRDIKLRLAQRPQAPTNLETEK